MRKIIALFVVLLWVLLSSISVQSEIDQPKPLPGSYVHDFAGVIPEDQKTELQAKAAQLKQDFKVEIAVVTITSLKGEDHFDYSMRMSRNFAHQESRKLVNLFSFIAFENLNIRGMLKNHCLAKSIADAAWSQLVRFTTYKAESAGRRVVQVSPYNTSQMCSGCGEIVEKDLSVRIHSCTKCGLTLDRDHNAAINILTLGLQSLPQSRIEAASFQDAE